MQKLEITENEENVCGITHFSEGEIYINKDISDYLIKRTIRHELTHAFLFSYGMGQYEEFSEENVCDFVETYGEDIVEMTNYIYKEYITQLMGV